jgi:hypothetical protein
MRCVDHSGKCYIVIGIHKNPEIGEHVTYLPTIIEANSAYHPIGNASLGELLL